ARTLSVNGLVLTARGQAPAGAAAARRAAAVAAPLVAKRPGDQNMRMALAEAYVSLGGALRRQGDRSGARHAWSDAVATIDSVARATGVTDQLAALSTALLELDRVRDAEPVVEDLLRRGYRRVTWIAIVRAHAPALVR